MKSKKLKVFSVLMILCIIISLNIQPAFAAISYTTGTYITALTENSVVINWENSVRSIGKIEYGTGGTYNLSVTESEDGLVSVGKRHSVRLTGLQPGTTYNYRAVSTEVTSLVAGSITLGSTSTSTSYSFTTHSTSKSNFSFVFMTDTHEETNLIPTLLGLPAIANNYDFVINGGDISNQCTAARVNDNFIDPSISVFAHNKPLYYSHGNHELIGTLSRDFFNYVPTLTGQYYFDFRQGNAVFAVLDSNSNMVDEYNSPNLKDTVKYRTDEAAWADNLFASSNWTNAMNKFVVVHNPVYSCLESQDPRIECSDPIFGVSAWRTRLSNAGTKLVLSGHSHVYKHTYPGDSGNAYHQVTVGQSQIAKVDVSPTGATVNVYDINGAKLDSFTIPQTITNYTNLAIDKTATASSVYSGSSPSNGNDESIATKWQPSSNAVNEWYKVDLGANHDLTGSAILWPQNGKLYKYKIEVSTNGSTWTTVVNKTSSNPSTEMYQTDSFTANARYVRITVTGLDTGTWATINEFKVFGN